ncbi:MAG: hypothetical protein K6U11_00230 [bacterium]|nr:hypothetical protein [bacterium]
MKKVAILLTLSFVLTIILCSCTNSKQSASSSADTEMEQKLVGKWKLDHADPTQENPPEDLTYILNQDHTCMMEFTNDKKEKQSIPGTYKVVEGGRIQFFRGEKLRKEFQVEFQGNDTIRLTEPTSKNSMTLARVAE